MNNKEKKFNIEKKEALNKNTYEIAKLLMDSALEIIKDPKNGFEISIKTNIKKDALLIKRGLIRMTQYPRLEIGGIVVGCKHG